MKKLIFSAVFAVLFGTAAMADGDLLVKQQIAHDLADLLDSASADTREPFMVSVEKEQPTETTCAAMRDEFGLNFACRVRNASRAFQAQTLALDISRVDDAHAPINGGCAGANVHLMPQQVVLRNICNVEGHALLYVAVLGPLPK